MFDSASGKMLTSQVILVKGDRIADVGPADKVQIPQGARDAQRDGSSGCPNLGGKHEGK